MLERFSRSSQRNENMKIKELCINPNCKNDKNCLSHPCFDLLACDECIKKVPKYIFDLYWKDTFLIWFFSLNKLPEEIKEKILYFLNNYHNIEIEYNYNNIEINLRKCKDLEKELIQEWQNEPLENLRKSLLEQ